MGKKDKGSLQETPQERALAEISLARYEDYKKRWMPLQKRAIEVVEGFQKEGSWERERAKTNAGAVGTQVDQAAEQIANADQNRGVDAGSSNFIQRQGEIGNERAKGVGIARAGADEAIDNAYVEGISNLMRIGSNQANQAIGGLSGAATMAGADQRSAAEASAANRAGNYELAGTAIGAASSYARPGIRQGTGAAPGEATGGVQPQRWGMDPGVGIGRGINMSGYGGN